MAIAQVLDAAVGEDLAQLGLALQREDGELVLGAAAGAQVEREEGLALQRFRGAAEQALGGGDLEVAAEDRRAVGALLGSLADVDPQRAVGAAAGAAARRRA